MGERSSIWTEAERRAFAPPVKETPTEWAERCRVLPASITAEAGRYRVARTPYLREVMDAVADRTVEEIICLKGAQIGWSEATRNVLGFWVDTDPGPCLLVMPSEDAARATVEERIKPLIDHTPELRRHQSPNPHDTTKSAIKFDSMSVWIGWAGSPQALASRPCRYVLLDEVDKYPAFSGREADPISLARERTKTFLHRKKLLIGSTPTTRQGAIWQAWESAGDKRDYHCPCPHCGAFQVLAFSQIKWPKLVEDKVKLADHIEQHRLAHYECQHCKATISESHKAKMIAGGRWVSEGQTIAPDGTISGEKPKSKRVGFRITSLLSPWLSWSAIAAEGLRSMDNPARWMNFRNSWLAEVFEQRVSGIKSDDIRQRAQGAPKPGVVPSWAGLVISSIDVQGDHFWYVIRAWGHQYKSQLIHYGTLMQFDEVATRCLNLPLPTEDGRHVTPDYLIIDAGYRTSEIYDFAATDSRIIPIKSANGRQGAPIKLAGNTSSIGVPLRYVDSQYFKDRLAVLRADPERWMVNSGIQDDYCQHMASEHKVVIKSQEVWQPVTQGAANHLLDCEVYNTIGASIAAVDLIPEERVLIQQRQQEQQYQPDSIRQKQSGWLGNNKGWLGGR